MAQEVRMKARFKDDDGFNATFKDDDGFKAKFGEFIQILPDPYEGPYEVTPTVDGFVLPTKEKNMARDLSVLEIPYAEVSNVTGTTVVIAS